MTASVSSMVGGYLNEQSGGSFTAGWVGGAVAGFVSGLGAGMASSYGITKLYIECLVTT
ncbi:MAG: hypothetical protein GX312_05950 [Candidatus Phytoplasma sp.]|nr:hypothetical protein [Phytoplasma sp.]